MKRRTRRPSRQAGAALLTAMIIVTLVSTLAAAMVWQQWRAIQVESAERDRTQAAWTLSSALQFASLVLRENRSNQYTALTDFWATPLAEGRVSTLNGTDKTTADDDNSQGFLSGSIEDAQSRYNLMNLITPVPATTPIRYEADPAQLSVLEKLCQSANVDGSVADRIQTALAEAASGTGAGAPLMPETVDQLTWFGVDQASIDALRPYVALLPDPNGIDLSKAQKVPTSVNANTASATVLAAILGGGAAQTIVQQRQRSPFKTQGEVETASAEGEEAWKGLSLFVNVTSNYFEVHGRLRLADRVLSQESLVYRDTNFRVRPLRSRRVSSVETVAP